MNRFLVIACLVCGLATLVAFAGLGGGRVAAPLSRGVPVTCHDLDFGLVPADDEAHAHTIRLVNRSARAVRIVGVTTACGENGCGRVHLDGPTEITPGSECRLTAEVKTQRAGPFTCPLQVHVDDGKLHVIELPLSGIGVSHP